MRHYGYRTLIPWLLLALALRITVPAGFMPAPITGHGSTWLVPCPSNATSAEWLAGMGDAGSHHGDDSDHSAFETCAFGAFTSLSPGSDSIRPRIPASTVSVVAAIPKRPLYRAPHPRAGETRAPPA